MKVGILIPTFNRLAYLKEALRSALEQTHGNLSVVVIDNGSKDGTDEFMRSVKDPRVTYVRNEQNLGISGSVNRGVGRILQDTPWCTVLCDDDFLSPGFVEQCLHAVTSRKARSILDSHRIFIDASGRFLRHAAEASPESDSAAYIKDRMNASRQTYLTGLFIHRDSLLEVGGYPEFATGLATDDALIVALAFKDRLVYQKDAVSYVRIHELAESRRCHDLPGIILSVQDFERYVMRACIEARRACPKNNDLFQDLTHRYAVRINSSCWLQNFHSHSEKLTEDRASNISKISDLVLQNPEDFSLRIRIAARFYSRYGVCPESWIVYRAPWVFVTEGHKFFMKKIRLFRFS